MAKRSNYGRTRLKAKQKPSAECLTLSPHESVAITGIGANATYALLRSGEMPSLRIGRNFRIVKSALVAWLEATGNKPAA
jgi:excisionase family DNA binding protein